LQPGAAFAAIAPKIPELPDTGDQLKQRHNIAGRLRPTQYCSQVIVICREPCEPVLLSRPM
jgi:hypothetical protein